MSRVSGKNVRISPFRQLVVDLLHFCQKVPAATVERHLDLSPLIAARKACVPRPSWCAIFLKAFGIMAARNPELRRTFMPFPWPHLYEHPISVANFTIERKVDDENVVFLAQVRRPEKRSLVELDQIIRTCKDAPLESVKFFQRAIRMSKVPWPFRRLSWWVSLNLFGKMRCHNFGTYSVSSVASEGAGILTLMTLLTATLHYGLFDERGNLPMRITFDHRALDGAAMARALVEMEQVLLGEILDELLSVRAIRAA